MLTIKRIYDEPAKEDGFRILVDRLWPRGVSKERAHLYKWAKEIAPSTELRVEFGHMTDRFDWFERAYDNELDKNPETGNFIDEVKTLLSKDNVTFMFAAKDPKINHATVLKEYIEKKLK
ncbi:MAG: DUF488 family protein [Bacteroidetes bacterium]|nr:DUF488 family protein [Bacteroidota bacterium]MCL2301682.1 DUF488 family protein [Lentimicrobiaceae bacterium]